MAQFKPRVVFDFDGVIHSYTSGWKGEDIIPDPPVPGINDTIQTLRERGYEVVVCSSRCISYGGMMAVKQWLRKHHIEVDNVTFEKIAALVYVDDRAICFDGNSCALLNKILNFKPWNQGGAS